MLEGVWSQELKGLEELLEGEGEDDGGLRALVREEQHSCHSDVQEIQVCNYDNLMLSRRLLYFYVLMMISHCRRLLSRR